MISALFVHDHDDHYEVLATLDKRVRREFRYEGTENHLELICISVFVKDESRGLEYRGIVIRKKIYHLHFLQPIDWSSVGHEVDGDTWYIRLPKTEFTTAANEMN